MVKVPGLDETLTTHKQNPKNTNKSKNNALAVQSSYKCNGKLCTICYTNYANATNIDCGHVIACMTCLSICKKCPICRISNDNIIQLFNS